MGSLFIAIIGFHGLGIMPVLLHGFSSNLIYSVNVCTSKSGRCST